MQDLIQIKEGMVMVPVADLTKLIEKIEQLEKRVQSTKGADNGHELLKAKDVMDDLGLKGRKSLDRRLYEWENPIPMVLEGHRLVIRRDKYEAWKREIGL